mmetsp:Transcript_22061/g.65339  ORF Transcript_22061/g.65339 Transcript_22061/m.65339 type:complete len:264 (+) Transcript_22061:803-1594(+)
MAPRRSVPECLRRLSSDTAVRTRRDQLRGRRGPGGRRIGRRGRRRSMDEVRRRRMLLVRRDVRVRRRRSGRRVRDDQRRHLQDRRDDADWGPRGGERDRIGAGRDQSHGRIGPRDRHARVPRRSRAVRERTDGSPPLVPRPARRIGKVPRRRESDRRIPPRRIDETAPIDRIEIGGQRIDRDDPVRRRTFRKRRRRCGYERFTPRREFVDGVYTVRDGTADRSERVEDGRQPDYGDASRGGIEADQGPRIEDGRQRHVRPTPD